MVEHANFKQILDSLSTAIIVLDYNLSVAYINVAGEMLIGVSNSQVEGDNIELCFTEADSEANVFKHALLENRYFTKRKAQWILHNATTINVDYTVTPNPEAEKIIIEVQPLDRMIRITREEAMISSQETSRNLIRSMAHEIKNPLGGIRGAAQLLSREFENDNDLSEFTQVIIDETDRLRNLVDRMLGPRTQPKQEKINPHEVLERGISLIKAQTQNSIDILRDYDPSIPDVCGDKEQLIQAVLNIMSNAVQALTEAEQTIDQPTIQIKTRVFRRFTIGRIHHPLAVCMGITDNGPGIDKKLLDDIFFPMITGRAEGTGLGLSISQNLIAQHEGLIECDSEPGKTTFAIYLPLDTDYA